MQRRYIEVAVTNSLFLCSCTVENEENINDIYLFMNELEKIAPSSQHRRHSCDALKHQRCEGREVGLMHRHSPQRGLYLVQQGC